MAYEMAREGFGGRIKENSLHPSYMMVVRGVDAVLEQAIREMLDILAVEMGEKEYRRYK